MIKKNVLTVLVVGLLMVALSSQVLAWGARPAKRQPWPDKGAAYKQICKRLDLTDEQKKSFESRSEGLKKEREAYHKEMREYGDKLKAEMQKDKPNRTTIHSLIRTSSTKKTEMHIKQMDSLLDLRETLTPKQKEKFEKMLKHKKDRRNDGRKRGNGRKK